jgi:hexosaminidase
MKVKSILKNLILALFFTINYFAQNPILPRPQNIQAQKGFFNFSSTTQFDLSSVVGEKILTQLNNEINNIFGFQIKGTQPKFAGTIISFRINNQFKDEEYQISITEKSISVEHGTKAYSHAISSMIQLLYFYSDKKNSAKIPCMLINDFPNFQWRGMHLDVSRHFFPVSFVKKYIDLLVLYKMNSFHWHLTDDQGWRIEIKKYPLLTEKGAWRNGSMIGHYREQKFDSLKYGGYYTQEEIMEVINYASERNIYVVPEIEMPGHSLAALSAYPQFACKDSVFTSARSWGVFDDVYCTKEETFLFLENIMEEVCALFPSEYIHIGGDEVLKNRWKNCKACQSRIKSEGLKNEEELQSYFIRRIEIFINSKGKKIIGWDEILEGGLAPNAAVMSWRGTEGGEHAARLQHNVVMSPGSHCYFDHYQSTPEFEPVAIGGFTPLEKVYQYNPIPESLNEKERKFILGAQANLWTEYITTTEHAEYMAVPRMIALSEALWTSPDKKNWNNFAKRLHAHFPLLEKKKINYSKALYDIKYEITPDKNSEKLSLMLSSAVQGKIVYTLDGSNPDATSGVYTSPLTLDKSCTLKSALIIDKKLIGRILEKKIHVNKATGKKISFNVPPSRYYNKTEGFGLVNGILESESGIRDKCSGWCNEDADFTIHFLNEISAKKLKIFFLSDEVNFIYPPSEIKVYINNSDNFLSLKSEKKLEKNSNQLTFDFVADKVKSLRIKLINPMKGKDCWILLDEVNVE